MSTEYQRTINKSAERHKTKQQRKDENYQTRSGSLPDAYAEAYGNLVPPAPRVELSKAALVIPSF